MPVVADSTIQRTIKNGSTLLLDDEESLHLGGSEDDVSVPPKLPAVPLAMVGEAGITVPIRLDALVPMTLPWVGVRTVGVACLDCGDDGPGWFRHLGWFGQGGTGNAVDTGLSVGVEGGTVVRTGSSVQPDKQQTHKK